MAQWAAKIGQILAGATVLLWLTDYGAMRVRGEAAFATITVHRFLTTPLKGRKEEYDFLGDDAVRCSRSIFPQAGSLPCWWVERHTTVWESLIPPTTPSRREETGIPSSTIEPWS